MRFKKLTDDDKTHIKQIYLDKSLSFQERINQLTSEYQKDERTIRRWMIKLGVKERTDKVPEQLEIAKQKKHDKTKRRFIVTWAQANVSPHKLFLKNLEAYSAHISADLIVIAGRYSNYREHLNKDTKESWADEVLPYLCYSRCDLNNSISILGDIKIQPTNSCPLRGFEGMTDGRSSIIGHPRIELKTIPVMEGCPSKYLFTTGAVTKPYYTDSRAGKTGEFNHSLGAAIIEIKDNDIFFFRQITANDKTGEFIDLFFHVKDGIVSREDSVEAIALGDVHVANCDQKVVDVTLNHLFKRLHPKAIFIHDIIDSSSISHHHLHDPFLLHQQEIDGTNSLEKEVNDMLDWLKQIEDYNIYIVKSNHDEHIDQFLRDTDWRKMTTLKNAIPYMEYATATLKGKAPNGIVPYIINQHYPKFKCLSYNDNILVKGWLMSAHGSVGASGSRGSLMQYSKLSTKALIGHSHVAQRIGGAASVGTCSKLRVDYNIGPSAWSNAHGVINRLGKMQHIIFFRTKNGLEYTTLD